MIKFLKNVKTLQMLLIALSHISEFLRRKHYFEIAQCVHTAIV